MHLIKRNHLTIGFDWMCNRFSFKCPDWLCWKTSLHDITVIFIVISLPYSSHLLFSATNLPTVSPNPSPEDESCISGYQLYAGCCYKLISQKQTWTQARETCIKDNAHLASIENYYEQAFIELLTADMTEHTWIGCSKEAVSLRRWKDLE